MRVDGFSQVHGPQGIRPPHHLQPPDRTSTGATRRSSGPVDQVEISSAAQEAVEAAETAESRQALIAKIRQQIADGTYETPAKLDHAVSRLLGQLG